MDIPDRSTHSPQKVYNLSVCLSICLSVYLSICLSLSLSLAPCYTYIYIFMYLCMHVYVCIYTYIKVCIPGWFLYIYVHTTHTVAPTVHMLSPKLKRPPNPRTFGFTVKSKVQAAWVAGIGLFHEGPKLVLLPKPRWFRVTRPVSWGTNA